MYIKYTCEACNKMRCFSKLPTTEILCPNCNNSMTTSKSDITSEIMTTPESRYLGDEAIYNTIGNRVSKKRNRHFATKN